jgi:hypothetical protein
MFAAAAHGDMEIFRRDFGEEICRDQQVNEMSVSEKKIELKLVI